ncbi:MAG: hypothetical protein M1827_007746 [Pycnora praestabilis]|nr:MAG: hypothetical protein M1827_007746 [Pycnora praestabilis]
MEVLKRLLIANRGEIALRIIKTSKSMGIYCIAIYTEADRASPHVAEADESVLLSGGESGGYTNVDNIVQIAKSCKVHAVIPGYGFLSENADFARAVAEADIAFVGPKPDDIESFGLKHKARKLAVKAGVPVVPGTEGLVTSEDEAIKAAAEVGFPVMLKATAGGGGMGLAVCNSNEEVKNQLSTIRSRGTSLFKNSGVFMEHYYQASHHIEVQIFGNGQGTAIHFGERECSIQRRHQKVIEECPSPFVMKHPGLREEITSAGVRLAEHLHYGSAGTIEYLVDDESGKFFFLEMNTRLQVEHGITELCYDVDLVALMLEQADAELAGKGGLNNEYLKGLQPSDPRGAAIEARVYAENPARDYAPSPGILQRVQWKELGGSRIDTWVKTGTKVTSLYDPLLAKVMYHASSREQAIEGLRAVLLGSLISGPPTNLDFLASILDNQDFVTGKTLTSFLTSFKYTLPAIDVIDGGAYTLIQDYPGRRALGKGFPHSGPMDPLAFQISNILVGNHPRKEGLEITLSGPTLLFLGPAVVALCGAAMEVELDGKSIAMWKRVKIDAGQRLKIGKTVSTGCRAYLAVHGGLPSVAEWFGSKATSPGMAIGGYQGRQLATGDLLGLSKNLPDHLSKEMGLPESLIPKYSSHWDIYAMVGPYDEGYLLEEDIEMIYKTKWKISHNAGRSGMRLIGPKPKWARADGGEGGAHPSNVIEYGYPLGTLNWTGDDPVIFPVDAPDFGGFVSSTTIIKADWWRLGQMKAGDTMQYKRVSLADALNLRRRLDFFLEQVLALASNELTAESVKHLDYTSVLPSTTLGDWGKAIIHQIQPKGTQPLVSYRQGADDYVLVDYGDGSSFDLNHRCRVTSLQKALRESKGDLSFSTGLINTVGCCNSSMIYYDGSKIPQAKLISYLVSLEADFGDLGAAKVPSRRFKLPITFESKKQTAAIQRYIETQRPYASYLPDNMDFVAKNNALTRDELKQIFLTSSLIAVSVGFFCALPLCLPVDPRHRISCPKANPSRVFTPEGQVSWGGSCMALYNVESPGGYQLTGNTIPGVDILGSKTGYSLDRPWLFEDFDQLTFYEVSEDTYDKEMDRFHGGQYEYKWEKCVFDMAEHNKLLKETKEEVQAIKAQRAEAQARMAEVEAETMQRWTEEKKNKEVPRDAIKALLEANVHTTEKDPQIHTIPSPMNANVWKVTISEGDVLAADQTVTVLEAMKMEIGVKAEKDVEGGKVEKVLVKPGDIITAGEALVLVRRS